MINLTFKRVVVCYVFLLACFPFQAMSSNIDDITWITHNYPPYNYKDSEGKAIGSAVELVNKILLKANSKNTKNDIQVFPWARAYYELQNNKNYALISTSRTAERENMFKWVGPIGPSKIVAYTKKDKKIIIKSSSDLEKYTTGAVNDSAPHKALMAANQKAKVELTPNIDESLKKLESGRIDLVVGDEKVLQYLVTQAGLDYHNYEPVYTLKEVDYWIAFNEQTSSDTVNFIQETLNSLEK